LNTSDIGSEITRLVADIIDIRKGFKVLEDKDTKDTYDDDEEEDDPYEDDEDDAWDEFEVTFLKNITFFVT
jgi:hypothetical protein